MNNDIISIISRISSFSVIIPLFIGLIIRKQMESTLKPVIFLILISLITELISLILLYNYINNMFVFNIYGIIEVILLIEFYKRFLNQFFQSKVHLILIALFTLLFVYNTFLSHKFKNIDIISTSIESIIFILYALISFYFILKNLVFENLYHTPFFWINTAFLLYFSGNLFLFTFSSYLENHESTYVKLYLIHSILNILTYILISIGFWKIKKH